MPAQAADAVAADAGIDPAGVDDDAASEKGPLRRCIVTRQQGERARMIRFVVGPGNVLVPDLAATLPGRGIWLSARADVVETARVRGAFAKAARAPVTVPSDLVAVLQAGLSRRIVDLLGFARRAGQAVGGFQKAHEWAVAGRAALVVQAADGSAEERARFLSGPIRHVPVAAPLSGAALGGVFGRDHVVHVAIAPGRLAQALAIETERLAGVAGLEPAPALADRKPSRRERRAAGERGANGRGQDGRGQDGRGQDGRGQDGRVPDGRATDGLGLDGVATDDHKRPDLSAGLN